MKLNKVVYILLVILLVCGNLNFSFAGVEEGVFEEDEFPIDIKIVKTASYAYRKLVLNDVRATRAEDDKVFEYEGYNATYYLADTGDLWISYYDYSYYSDTKVKKLNRVFEDYKFSDIAAGRNHILALDEQGYLYGWGSNTFGQLGIGTSGDSSESPVRIYSTKKFKTIACSELSSYAIDENGKLYAWGSNKFGETVYSNTTMIEDLSAYDEHDNEVHIQTSPVQILPEYRFKTVSAGGYGAIAIDTNGDAWGWGHNEYGEVGNYESSIRTEVYTYNAIRDDGIAAWYWYDKSFKYLNEPMKIDATKKYKDVAKGGYHSILLTEDGLVYTIGNNKFGQLGNGQPEEYYTQLVQPFGFDELIVKQIIASDRVSGFVDENNNFWMCGYNKNGQLGNGTTTNANTPVSVLKGDVNLVTFANNKFYNSMFAIDEKGNLYGWGGDYNDIPNLDPQAYTKPNQITDIITEFTVTFMNGGVVAKTEIVTVGQGATAPTISKEGYTLSWDTDFSNVTSDLTVNAIWTANTNTPYKVEHYLRTLDTEVETYELVETENKVGTTDALAIATTKSYTGFTENTSHSDRIISGTVAADGSLVLKVYYDRNTYNITYELNGGTATSNLASTYVYGKQIVLSNRVEKEGYTFAGWYDNSSLTGNTVTSISEEETGNKTFYAKWIENDELTISSNTYTIDEEERYITHVSPNTELTAFLSNITTNGTAEVVNLNGNTISAEDFVGTGYKLKITLNGETKEYEIVVRGDIDGNGKITVTDLSMLNQAIVKRVTLTGVKEEAADINYDGKITVTDLSMMNQNIVGKITL